MKNESEPLLKYVALTILIGVVLAILDPTQTGASRPERRETGTGMGR
jgi:hypothetical protein